MEEIWKRIKGYEDYQVSNYGRVKSYRTKEKFLRPSRKKNGKNYIVIMDKDGKQKGWMLEQLVYLTFKQPTIDLFNMSIKHLDGDLSNDHLDNLEMYKDRQLDGRNRDLPTGVYKLKNGKYSSYISANGIESYLGTFTTVESARNAYCEFLQKSRQL